MRIEKWNITKEGRVNITYYLHDAVEDLQAYKQRPIVIVCPGGGYTHLSNREADPVALSFMAKGFHVAVLKYSIDPYALFPNSLIELSKAVKYTRDNASRFGIIKDKIAICGFSAGGHVTATFSTLWNRDFVKFLTEVEAEENKPNAIILGYPVITKRWLEKSGVINKILNEFTLEEFKLISANENVSKDTPPAFIFHSFEDKTVPVSDSLDFAKAMEENNVPFELHIYEKGVHGFVLGNELTRMDENQPIDGNGYTWLEMSCKWLWDIFQ